MSLLFRWGTYVLESGAGLDAMFKSHLGACRRDVRFITGRGFDPRMNLGLRMLLAAGGEGRRHITLLQFEEGSLSPSRRYQHLIDQNIKDLNDLINDPNAHETKIVKMWSPDGRRISSRSAAEIFRSVNDFEGFTDIVLDVSSLPRSIFYPLMAKLLHLVERGGRRINLFVIVAENPDLDKQIVDEGIDEDADYVHLFRSGAERMATAEEPNVWIPVLGEGQSVQLRRLHDLIMPAEICPLFPSPALNPRRADDLVAEYQQLLFDGFRVEPRNFIYASERNPFEVYRQVRQTVLYYRAALLPLGGARAVISSVSSKLLSIGSLLAAYELKQARHDVGIAHIEAQGYRLENERVIMDLAPKSVLFGLWLLGECYA